MKADSGAPEASAESSRRPLAVITGASSGIGLELARLFGRRGYDLIVAARRRERLASLAAEFSDGERVEVVAADLADAEGTAALRRAFAGAAVDVLVNNAGSAACGRFAEQTPEQVRALANLNAIALAELTQAALPGMIERGRGRILNVASVAGFQALPGMAAYAASKAFALSLSEALSEELTGTGVTVTALCPGLTRTESAMDWPVAPDFMAASPEAVAEAGYRACMNGEAVCVPGLGNQALVTWLQCQPRWLRRFLAGFAGRAALSERA